MMSLVSVSIKSKLEFFPFDEEGSVSAFGSTNFGVIPVDSSIVVDDVVRTADLIALMLFANDAGGVTTASVVP